MLAVSPHVSLTPSPTVREGILTRRTFRAFLPQPVSAEVRERVLDAARLAAAPGDTFPVRFVVLDDHDLKRQLYRLTRESKEISNHWEDLFRPVGLRGYVQYWPGTPFCVAVCVNPRDVALHIHNTWTHHLAGAAATQNMALAARYLGLGMVVYSHFSQEKLKRLLDVPFEWDVLGVMGLGYPDLKRLNPRVFPISLTRLPLDDLVADERYGMPGPADILSAGEPPGLMPDLLATMRALLRTVRFGERRVPGAFLFEILRAAQWAPSAGNFQPVRYVVVRDHDRLARLDAIARESLDLSAHWFSRYRQGISDHPDWTRVPLALAVIVDPTKGGPHIHGEATHMHGAGMAAQNIWLTAQALGLGTDLVTHWIEEKVKVLIDCPRTWDLAGVMPLGFPVEVSGWNRPALADLVDTDAFGRRVPSSAGPS